MNNIKKHFSTFKHYLSFADVFGQKIDLTYNKEIFYRTYYGAIFTILIFIFLIIQAIAGYKELTTRLNPIINSLEVEEENVPRIDLKKENITIAIGFVSENRSEYLYDKKYFEIESKYVSKSKNDSSDKTMSSSLNLQNCVLYDFKQFGKYFENFNLAKALCLRSPNLSELELFSKPEEFQENYIKFNFKFCSNSSRTICEKPEDILSRFNYLNIYINIVHDYFDAMDIKEPIKRRLSMVRWNFEDYQIQRKDSVYLTQHSLRDYNNLFMTLSEPPSKNFIAYSEKNILRNFKFGKASPDGVNNKFMELYIKAHYIPVKITRKYNTFVDLLGNLGGLFNVFFIIGNLIFGYIDRTLLDCKMINDHFNIVDTKQYEMASLNKERFAKGSKIKNLFSKRDDINFSKKNSKSNIENINEENRFNIPLYEEVYFNHRDNKYSIKNFSYGNSLQNTKNSFKPFKPMERNSASSYELNKGRDKNINYPLLEKDSKEKKFKFRYYLKDIILSLFCIQKKTLKKKNEIFINCKRLIDNYLDIKNLISLSQEFKVIRSILFDKLQLSLINFYKKPILKINEENQSKTILIYRKSIYENENVPNKGENFEGIDELSELRKKLYLLNERNCEDKDKVDEKILEFSELK